MKAGSTRRVTLLALIGLSVLAGMAWWLHRAPASVPAGAAPAASAAKGGAPGGARPVPVEAVRVTAADFSDEITAVGTLKSRDSVVLRAEISGRVARIAFKDGEVVRQGVPLVSLDDAIPAAELAQAEANRALAQTTWQRQQELFGKKFISQQALDASAATLKVQDAAVQLARARLAKSTIRAPFRGVVGLRDISVGDYVKDGDTLVNLEDISSLHVDFRVPETVFPRLARGQGLTLLSDALPGKTFAARIEAIDPQIDPVARSVAVRGWLDNRDGALRPGMFVRVRIAFGERRGVILLPEEAIMPGAQPAVFRVVDGVVERVPVKTGSRRDAQVEIAEGLAVGDVVVTAGQMKLRPGAAVVVSGGEPPAAGQAAPKP